MMYCNYIILYVDSTDRAAINTKTLQWEIASLTFSVFLCLQSSYKDKAARTLVVFSRNFVISGYLSMTTALNLLENNSVNRIPFPTSSKFLRHQNIHSRLVYVQFVHICSNCTSLIKVQVSTSNLGKMAVSVSSRVSIMARSSGSKGMDWVCE